MERNWYRDTLVALKMRSRKNTVHNRISEISIRSDDATLRELCKKVISEMEYSGLNTESTSLADAKSVNTSELIRHCESRAYLEPNDGRGEK